MRMQLRLRGCEFCCVASHGLQIHRTNQGALKLLSFNAVPEKLSPIARSKIQAFDAMLDGKRYMGGTLFLVHAQMCCHIVPFQETLA